MKRDLISIFVAASISALASSCLINSDPLSNETAKSQKVEDWSWVPKNFHLDSASGNIAYRYLKSSEANCKFNMPCIQVEVLARDGCDTLYAQTSLVDANGVNVGYSNDLTKSIGANGKAILTFTNTVSTATNIANTQFKCY